MTLVRIFCVLLVAVLSGCAHSPDEFYGTTEPFASEAVYFVLTDRFVNGDPANDHRDQGGANRTFDLPLSGPNGETDNIGYLGGDFRGILDHADYIREMGFTSVWITPIVDNPDEAFTGGEPITWGSVLKDRGKSGYHGYWGVNFYRLDEHLPSPGLDFASFTQQMKSRGLNVVLDIVANHGSPSFTMPSDQPKFGELYDRHGTLIADHQNLPPEELDPQNNPLHRFFRTERDFVQLSNLNDENPVVQDYLIGAVLQWLDQGAHALRIDTIRHVPHAFWRTFAARVRARHPGVFMFGESFDYEAANIAPFTWDENGAISVLDFPLKAALAKVFDNPNSDFASLESALYLEGGPYKNAYELMTFYDNHDMARLNASDEGFIDAHNWLFTARGIPVIYYGSETGFMRGTAEHAGNRNYFGRERIDAARTHPIRTQLARIANVRRNSVALQKGLQLNLRLQGDEAVFYRVFQHAGQNETALVLLNKGSRDRAISVSEHLQSGVWRDAFTGEPVRIADRFETTVPAHGIRVFLFAGTLTRADTRQALARLMSLKGRPLN
jgi:cyclomaltodextrin glucanotransferase